MSPAPSTPTGLMCRFGLLVERLRWTLADWVDRNPRNRDVLGPLALLLWKYLQRTTRKLAALHAQFAAGTLVSATLASATLASATRKDRARRRAAEPAESTSRGTPLPSGPVLARFGAGYLGAWLLALVEDAEMQALLAASPQAGRLLRPLWRRLTNDPLPAPLRLPPKPPRSEQPLAAAALAEAPGEATPHAPPQIPPDARAEVPPGPRRAASAKRSFSLPPWPPPLFRA